MNKRRMNEKSLTTQNQVESWDLLSANWPVVDRGVLYCGSDFDVNHYHYHSNFNADHHHDYTNDYYDHNHNWPSCHNSTADNHY